MQPASSLESVMKSVESSQSSIGQGHVLNQEDQDHMELLENILSIPSWSEVGVKNWDYGVPGVDPSKISKSELSACLAGDNKPQNKGVQDGATDPQIGDMVDDSYLFAQLQQQRSLLAEGSITQLIDRASSLGNSDAMNNQGVQGSDHLLQRLADDTNAGSMVSGMPMGMLSAVGQGPTRSEVGQPQPLLPSSWRQPFIGGVPMSLGQANPEMFLRETNSNGSHLYGRNEPLSTFMGRDGKSGVMFNVYGGPQPHLGQPRAPVQPSQQGNNTSQGLQSGQQAYRAQGSATQPQPVNPVSGQAPRPRVRARRGQATDPHSIAERLRRERIAERMKALQDLVPNANKTDKASMLDEIVDYVKFLQLQVKVLSMSRLGGAGAVPSLVADLPAESANSLLASTLSRSAGISHDGLANAERQVARLMDEDMGSAMQYLQSKGLCLMPISLATASGKVPLSALQSIGSGDNKQYTETSVSVATDRSSSGNTMGVSAAGNGNSGGSSTGKMGMKDSKDGAVADKNGDGRQSSKSPKSLPKSNDEAQRRIQ